MHINDVVIHVDETLDSQARHDLEDQMRAMDGVAMLASLPASRRIAVLGDMRELGDQAEELHRSVGVEIAERGIDRLYWLGEHGPAVRDAARAMRPSAAVELHGEMGALIDAVARDARDGDIVLVKASRGTRLDEFVAGLLDRLQARS